MKCEQAACGRRELSLSLLLQAYKLVDTCLIVSSPRSYRIYRRRNVCAARMPRRRASQGASQSRMYLHTLINSGSPGVAGRMMDKLLPISRRAGRTVTRAPERHPRTRVRAPRHRWRGARPEAGFVKRPAFNVYYLKPHPHVGVASARNYQLNRPGAVCGN